MSKLTVGFLLVDYQMWCKEVAAGERDPFLYMEELMNAYEQPPKDNVYKFLCLFYKPEIVEEWMNKIAWKEDEEPFE